MRSTLRRNRVIFGRNVRGRKCGVQNKGRIEIGNNVELNSYPDNEIFKTILITWGKSALIRIGNNSILNGVVVHSNCSVTIGNDCMFGAGTLILDSNFHSLSSNVYERKCEKHKAVNAPVVIGNNVWVGMRAIILKGVSIGDNAIVGAGSVVAKDIPSNQVFAGNPARFIKKVEKSEQKQKITFDFDEHFLFIDDVS